MRVDGASGLPFEVAAGSVMGRAHQSAGRNNQDAWALSAAPGAVAAVVCDGCSGGARSEVGAVLGARWIAEEALGRAARGEDPTEAGFWEGVRGRLLERIEALAATLGEPRQAAVAECFLFTAVGVLLTPRVAQVFSAGDGLVVLDGRRTVLGPFEGNAPPYLAYGLLDGMEPPELRLEPPVPAERLGSVLLATDGVLGLVGDEEAPLASFWRDDRCFTNRDLVRRRLTQLGRGAVALGDDATLLVLRRLAAPAPSAERRDGEEA